MVRVNHRATASIATIVLAALLVLSARVHAGPLDPPKSRDAYRHLIEGNRKLQVRDYALAIKSYKRGYLIEAKPVFIHNLGLAHRLQGKYKIAIGYYRNYYAS